MWKIGNVTIDNQVVAAPLAGISNPVYRQLMHDYGVGLSVSEMISDKALHYENARTFDMCRTFPDEHPVSLQLFGNDPDTLAEATEYLCTHTDCDMIDFNMGCPVPKVLKAKAGSYLMAHPEEAFAAVSAIVSASDRPVTVKMRAGWDMQHINCVEIAQLCEKAGAAAIAVHGRTKTQLYSGTSNNEYIRMVKQAVSIPVIGNGDIHCGQDAKRMIEETGCDAVMVGRALIGKPYLIQEIRSVLEGKEYTEPDALEKIRLLYEYAEKLCAYDGERNGIAQMRGISSYFISSIPYASTYKAQLSRVNSLDEMKEILDSFVKKMFTIRQ